ncbi:MAG: hypothetical protein SFV81_02540 [Pirellulaceae bacterium]|nr:hypothetical protein [Pirellulaceae bacterium]
MFLPAMIRARLLRFPCLLPVCFAICLPISLAASLVICPTAHAQVDVGPKPVQNPKPVEEPKVAEEPKPAQEPQVVAAAQVVEVRVVEGQAAAQAVEIQDGEVQEAAGVAVQAVQIVGEAMIEEGVDVAVGAVQMFAVGMEGDPQASKLLSKVAVDNALIRRVCKLDDEQLKQLESLDAKWVKGKAAAGKQAGNLAAGVIRVFAGGNVGMQPDNPVEASSRVTTAYKTKLKEILKPEQLAEYEKHVKEREAFRRQANAQCIVSVLEDRLSLNDTQRDELAKSLTEWSGIQKMQATFYFQNQAYIPNLPAPVLKALTATQRKILDGMQKADFQFEMFNDGQEAIFIAQ